MGRKVSPRYAFGCIIQNINRRILPSRVYQRCGPKNRDSLRARRPVQSVLSSERARARFSRSPLHNKSLSPSISPTVAFCPSLSPPSFSSPVSLPFACTSALCPFTRAPSFSPRACRALVGDAGSWMPPPPLLASALGIHPFALRDVWCRGNGRRGGRAGSGWLGRP